MGFIEQRVSAFNWHRPFGSFLSLQEKDYFRLLQLFPVFADFEHTHYTDALLLD